MRRRAAFVDRDGVINRALVRDAKPYPPRSLQELQVLPGVADGLAVLRARGFLNIVVTNQPDVARGQLSRATVESFHQHLASRLAIDAFYVCWHDDADNCDCRKPRPGLIVQAARDHDISIPQSFLVGDRWRDIAAGQQAGCRTVWIDCGYAEQAPRPPIDFVAADLLDAANWIVRAGAE